MKIEYQWVEDAAAAAYGEEWEWAKKNLPGVAKAQREAARKALETIAPRIRDAVVEEHDQCFTHDELADLIQEHEENAIETVTPEIREETLKEAAEVCDDEATKWEGDSRCAVLNDVSDAILALKEKNDVG